MKIVNLGSIKCFSVYLFTTLLCKSSLEAQIIVNNNDLNVLYKEHLNPIQIVSPCSFEILSIGSPDIIIQQIGEGQFNLIPKILGKVMLEVAFKNAEDSIVNRKYNFNVLPMPLPSVFITERNETNKITISELDSAFGLKANYSFHYHYKLISFTVFHLRNNSIITAFECKNDGEFNLLFRGKIKPNLKAGDVLLFLNILCVVEGGKYILSPIQREVLISN